MNASRLRTGFLVLFSVMVLGLWPSFEIDPRARAQEYDGDPPPVVRIEEDWRLVLNEPDNGVESPQFHTTMSPNAHVNSNYAQVLWNYREVLDFEPGGLQLQSWDGDYLVRYRVVRQSALSTAAETITWTQALETDGEALSFEIVDGDSTTWGSFGRDMRIDSAANLANLNSYSSDVSESESCITYGSNRVDELVITEVRRYAADGSLVSVDSTPRYVYLLGDDE